LVVADASVDAAELRAFTAGHAPARRSVPEGFVPRPRSHQQRRDASPVPVPAIGVSAFELHVREHVAAADEPHAKRAGEAALNGSIIALGSAQS
ncbi:hypothetical protein NY486_13875, partial [Enterobacter hormaechei]|nr:hypothetical protein [Enterobacter hormaechei]